MNEAGTVVSLHYCPGHRKPMVAVLEAAVTENLGFRNDMHALPDSSRQVLLIESETLKEMGLKPGEVRENIATKGILLMRLPRRQRLSVGCEVILEITQACAPCSRMEEIRPDLLRQIAGRRGMLARVIRGGLISNGDAIALLDK